MASYCDALQQEGRLKAKVTSLLAPWWSCQSEVWKLQKIIRFIKKNNTYEGQEDWALISTPQREAAVEYEETSNVD